MEILNKQDLDLILLIIEGFANEKCGLDNDESELKEKINFILDETK